MIILVHTMLLLICIQIMLNLSAYLLVELELSIDFNSVHFDNGFSNNLYL